jgi:hypothetical protein
VRQTRKRSLLNDPKTQLNFQGLGVGVYSSEVERCIMIDIIKGLSFENFWGMFTCIVEPLSNGISKIYRPKRIAEVFFFPKRIIMLKVVIVRNAFI